MDSSNALLRANRLVDWATTNGAFLHEQVEVFRSETYGIALRVKKQNGFDGLAANCRIVSCPFKLSLSYLNTVDGFQDLQAHSVIFPAAMFKALEPHVIGNFFLVQQYLTINTSYWAPYVKSLPQPDEVNKINTPLYYSKDEMNWLRGTNLEAGTKNRIAKWTLEWEKGSSILNESQELKCLQGKWTFELYKWAGTIFSSRSFVSDVIPVEVFGEKSQPSNTAAGIMGHEGVLEKISKNRTYSNHFPVLFPLVDIANHSPHAQVTWFSNVQEANKNISIIIESGVPAGNQIFNNYAPKSNTELLLGYGFVIPDNDEVAISFKPLQEDLMVIRRQQHCYNESKPVVEKQIYHIRNKPCATHSGLRSLPELRAFETGCVDTLALCISNQREMEFFRNNPRYCPEENAAASLGGHMARNTFHVLSMLREKLRTSLDEIIQAGSDLSQPQTLAEKTAMIYRHGQISVLKHSIGSLERTLDLFLSNHRICGHIRMPDPDGFGAANADLLSLDCAFSWLKVTHEVLWGEVTAIVRDELDVEPQSSETEPLNYVDVIDGDWDFTLWCLWTFLVLSLTTESLSGQFQDDPVHIWIGHMISVYDPNGTSSFVHFSGDTDECSTLETMISGLSSHPMNRKLLNLASLIVQEESFPAEAQISPTDVIRRKQRIFCLARLET